MTRRHSITQWYASSRMTERMNSRLVSVAWSCVSSIWPYVWLRLTLTREKISKFHPDYLFLSFLNENHSKKYNYKHVRIDSKLIYILLEYVQPKCVINGQINIHPSFLPSSNLFLSYIAVNLLLGLFAIGGRHRYWQECHFILDKFWKLLMRMQS